MRPELADSGTAEQEAKALAMAEQDTLIDELLAMLID